MAQRLADISQAVPAEEASLAGLVHDIGHLVLTGLGPRYTKASLELQRKGMNPVEIEWETCGASHAEIGADLLQDWLFPEDMVEAVRHHHAPCLSSEALTSVLFVAESLTGNDEDVCEPIEYLMAGRHLGLTTTEMESVRTSSPADLGILQFAA